MASTPKKITELNELSTSNDADVIVIVDVANDETKKQTKENFLKEVVGAIAEVGASAETYPANANVAVNNFVYLDGNGTLQRASNGASSTARPYGVVVTKPTSTTATVVRIGERTGFLGIVPNTIYYLGTNGGIVDRPPDTGIIVPVGIGKNGTTIFVRLSNNVIFN